MELKSKAKRTDAVKYFRFLIYSKGFTFVELLTSIAIIGILAAVGIQQYSQYKIRGYDADSKQTLNDMNLICKAYWTLSSTSDECDIAKAKEYGFVEHPDVVATLPPSTIDTFCASAKHNSSPNTYSINNNSLIAQGIGCSGEEEKAVSINLENKELIGCVQQCFDSLGCGENCITTYMGSYRGGLSECYNKCQSLDGYRISQEQYENGKQLPYYSRSILVQGCLMAHHSCGSAARSEETSFRVKGIPVTKYEWQECRNIPESCDLEPEGPLNPKDSDCSDDHDNSDKHLVAFSRDRQGSFPCNSKPSRTSICSNPWYAYLKVCEGVQLDKDLMDHHCKKHIRRGFNIPDVCFGQDPGDKLFTVSERTGLDTNPFYSKEATFEGLIFGGKSIEFKR